MSYFKRKRWAYYSRNDSYSKSLNAERAEENGRFPKSRAAKEMGISLNAFKQGYYAADYKSSEYHHIGRYAQAVTYFDTNELNNDWKFWFGVAKCYKGKKKLEFLKKAAQIRLNNKFEPPLNKSRNSKSLWERAQELTKLLGKIKCCHSKIGLLSESNWLNQQLKESNLIIS